jgi:hypothetical protein
MRGELTGSATAIVFITGLLAASACSQSALAQEGETQQRGGFFRKLGEAVDQGVRQGVGGAQGAVDGINAAQAGLRGQIRGQVTMADGNVLTCKVGEQAGGILGNDGLFRAIPLAVPLPSGQVLPNLCDDLDKAGVLVAVRGAAPAGGGKPADFVAFSTTELAGLFERFPQPGGGRTAEWPRAAITLLEEPSWGPERPNAYGFKYPDLSCWKFRAKVWDSATVSRDIPAFHVCSDAVPDMPGGDVRMTYQVWSGIVTPQPTIGSTGILRTEGPLWPDNPLPVGKPRDAGRLNPATFTGDILSVVLYNTGVDFNLQDRRVWLNLGPPDQLPPGWTPVATGGAPSASVAAEVNALQQRTEREFAAIQANALNAGAAGAVPAAAGVDALAADGAKLCRLSADDMLVLRGTAVMFVRYDKTSGAIVMSELVDGSRREVTLDGNAFAARAAAVAPELAKGGMSCGRAFWSSEAIKAASAAMM